MGISSTWYSVQELVLFLPALLVVGRVLASGETTHHTLLLDVPLMQYRSYWIDCWDTLRAMTLCRDQYFVKGEVHYCYDT